MTRIVGVHFRNADKMYYFNPKDYVIKSGDKVIVETARGMEMGSITLPPQDVEDNEVVQPLKNVIRVATEEDIEKDRDNHRREEEAVKKCKELIRKHELDMKLVDAEYTFDNSKLLFYFTAENRVDFRELVKDLAAIYRTRIELRQIGVRDETKVLGGIGICGRELCCKTYLSNFAPVSIKMAKTQNLSLNPTKISGVCGRLMCCLKNEEETYEYLNASMPKIGDEIQTEDGEEGVVQNINILRQRVRVLFEVNDSREVREYPVDQITVTGHRKKGQQNQQKAKDQNKDQAKEQGKGQNKDQAKDQGKGQNKDQAKDQGRGQNKDQAKDQGKGQNKDQAKDQGKGQNKDQTRDQSRGQSGEDHRQENTEGPKNGSQETENGQGHNKKKRHNRHRNKNRNKQGENQNSPKTEE